MTFPVTGATVDRSLELVRDVLDEVDDEIRAAIDKHGFVRTNLNPNVPLGIKLANLVEEVGEVAETMTYDKIHLVGDREKELKQVAGLAVAWVVASRLEREGQ